MMLLLSILTCFLAWFWYFTVFLDGKTTKPPRKIEFCSRRNRRKGDQ